MYDYEYLCKGLGMLSGLQTRIYKGQVLIYEYFYLDFKPDIVSLVIDRINTSPFNAEYFDTSEFLLFGMVRVAKDDTTIVIGPTSQIKLTKAQISDVLRTLCEPYSRSPELATYFQNTPNFPIENFIQIICFLNYALNNEKLTVGDLVKRDISIYQSTLNKQKELKAVSTDEVPLHNTYKMEKKMMSYIKAGNPEALARLLFEPSLGRVGKIAHDSLRQLKNTFICAATLASRAAVAGGLSTETAFSLSDIYIQKAELMNDYQELTKLNIDMLMDYVQRVEQTKYRDSNSKIVAAVSRYINQNINRKISVQEMAKALYLNRSYLCEKFKSDTGFTLTEFITRQKVDEAKRQLEVTNLSIVQISEYLCFSSQCYFQNVFKKMVGCTPREYRDMS